MLLQDHVQVFRLNGGPVSCQGVRQDRLVPAPMSPHLLGSACVCDSLKTEHAVAVAIKASCCDSLQTEHAFAVAIKASCCCKPARSRLQICVLSLVVLCRDGEERRAWPGLIKWGSAAPVKKRVRLCDSREVLGHSHHSINFNDRQPSKTLPPRAYPTPAAGVCHQASQWLPS